MAKGGCYCGKVRFEVKGEVPPVIFCHCDQCRRISGHYVAGVSGVQNRTHIEGEVRWFPTSPGYERGFCPNCGTHMFWHDMKRGHLSIMAGSFDKDVELEAKAHIFVGQKAGYYSIDDGLPQFGEDIL